jgi:hypothetical protein
MEKQETVQHKVIVVLIKFAMTTGNVQVVFRTIATFISIGAVFDNSTSI